MGLSTSVPWAARRYSKATPRNAHWSLVMRPFRFSFHPVLLAVIGVASGALALGASTLSYHVETALSYHSATLRGDSKPAVVFRTPYSVGRRSRCFPALFSPRVEEDPASLPLDVPSPSALARTDAERASLIPVLANNRILAFYGKPGSKRMGILGEYSKEDLARILEGYAKLYDDQNGCEGVVPAFYLIYGTCWPGGEIGYLKDSVVQDYIEFAQARGWLVFVDHQIGKYPVADAMKRLLPWLKYPNVHIALDPEWRTESPMKVIGAVSADEINSAEQAMSDYMEAEGIRRREDAHRPPVPRQDDSRSREREGRLRRRPAHPYRRRLRSARPQALELFV